MRRPTPLILVAAAIAAAGPAPALAEDLCVTPQATCAPGKTYATPQQALDAAAADGDADRVLLPAGSFAAPDENGLTYVSSNVVEIVGAGRAETVLQGAGDAKRVLDVRGTTASRIRSLALRIPASAPNGSTALLTSAGVSDVAVADFGPLTDDRQGIVLLDGADLDDAEVSLRNDPNQGSIGVLLDAAGSVVTDVTSSAALPFVTDAGAGVLDRVRADGWATGIDLLGDTTVRNCLVTMRDEGATASTGIRAKNANATVTNCTISGPPGASALASHADGATANLSASGVVVRGFEHALSRRAVNGGTAHLAAAHADLDQASLETTGSGKLALGPQLAFHADAGFVDEAAGDFRLRPGSPLVDAGAPGAATSAADLLGLPRLVGPRVDIGAFELQALPPVADASAAAGAAAGTDAPAAVVPAAAGLPRAVPSRAARLSRLTVSRRRARLTVDRAARIVLRVQRRRRGRLVTLRTRRARAARAGRVAIRLGRLRPGRYRVTVVATTSAGARSAPLSRTLIVR